MKVKLSLSQLNKEIAIVKMLACFWLADTMKCFTVDKQKTKQKHRAQDYPGNISQNSCHKITAKYQQWHNEHFLEN